MFVPGLLWGVRSVVLCDWNRVTPSSPLPSILTPTTSHIYQLQASDILSSSSFVEVLVYWIMMIKCIKPPTSQSFRTTSFNSLWWSSGPWVATVLPWVIIIINYAHHHQHQHQPNSCSLVSPVLSSQVQLWLSAGWSESDYSELLRGWDYFSLCSSLHLSTSHNITFSSHRSSA